METKKDIFNRMIREAGVIAILGHISPDGDCLGSTLGVRNYILGMCRAEGAQKTVRVFLEPCSDKFAYLEGYDEISHDPEEDFQPALCIVCDCADEARIGKFARYLKQAQHSFCLDHHITNQGFAECNHILPDASSASEVAYDLMEPELIDRAVSECIYTGIVHDSGVFRYPTTSLHTMEIAGHCMESGIDFNRIIDESFFAMNFNQKQILGEVLSGIKSHLSGRFVTSIVSRETMDRFGIKGKDMDGIVDELRTTRGTLGAALMYETRQKNQYKLSLRSNDERLDVSLIASRFGGGGHKRASGCFLSGDMEAELAKLLSEVEKQIGAI